MTMKHLNLKVRTHSYQQTGYKVAEFWAQATFIMYRRHPRKTLLTFKEVQSSKKYEKTLGS